MSKLLFQSATVVLLLAGGGHALGTLVDLIRPFLFTPRDLSFKDAMDQQQMRITSRTTIWRAWLGFNLNFGLGVAVVSLIFLLLSILPGGWPLAQTLRPLAIGFTAILFVSALRFWFYLPAIATGYALVGFSLSQILG